MERGEATFPYVATITEMLKPPVYLNTQLRAYIGTPLIIGGKLWGTLNYSLKTPRKRDYSLREIEFVESQARRVAELVTS